MDYVLDAIREKLYTDNKHKEYYQKFSLLKTDEDRVIYAMKLLKKYNISPIFIENGKSIDKSVEYKNKANKLYTTPKKTSQLQLNEIVELYTKSAVFAPPKSRALSLAYANRSAALFAARLYDDCILDIERALQLNYPDELKAKLYARKVRCLIILNNNSSTELNDAIDETRRWLEKMDLNNSGRVIIEKTLNNLVDMPVEKQRIKLDDERNLPAIPNDNSEIPGASSAIAINYSKEFGRHIVATRDIDPGEILAVQNNYSWILHQNKIYTHCWNCSRQTWCGIPCEHCVNVIYCNENCRNEDWNNYHDIECKVLGLMIALKVTNLVLLSMRMLIKTVKEAGSIQGLMEKLSSIDSCTDERTRGFVDNIFDHQKYESVYSLARNSERRSAFDLFDKSLNSFYTMFLLATRSELFGERLNGDLEELEKNKMVTFVGGLIMRYRQITPCNAHQMIEEFVGDSNPIERGAALMPFLSFFNHSCNPMVNRKSLGKMMVLYSDLIIKKGQQIFDNYGMHYALQPKEVRQQTLLQQYYFSCQCIACEEDWPLYLNLPSFMDQKLSEDAKTTIFKAYKNCSLYLDLATIGDVENKPEIIEDLLNIMRCICLYGQLPCREYNNAMEILKRIQALLGSRWQSLD